MLRWWIRRLGSGEQVLFERSRMRRAWFAFLFSGLGFLGLSGVASAPNAAGRAFGAVMAAFGFGCVSRFLIAQSLTYVPGRDVVRVRNPFRTIDLPIDSIQRAEVITRPVPILAEPALRVHLRDGTVRDFDVISSAGQERGPGSLHEGVERVNSRLSAP